MLISIKHCGADLTIILPWMGLSFFKVILYEGTFSLFWSQLGRTAN